MVRSWIVAVVALAVIVGGVILSDGPPRVLVENQGLRLQHPWTHPVALFGAALGAAALAWTFRRWWARVPAIAVALVILLSTYALWRFRLETDHTGLRLRDWTSFHENAIPWSGVAQVDSGPQAVILRATDGRSILIDAHDLRPEDRATLDRTIARNLASAPRLDD